MNFKGNLAVYPCDLIKKSDTAGNKIYDKDNWILNNEYLVHFININVYFIKGQGTRFFTLCIILLVFMLEKVLNVDIAEFSDSNHLRGGQNSPFKVLPNMVV